jgi:hypothetical protein
MKEKPLSDCKDEAAESQHGGEHFHVAGGQQQQAQPPYVRTQG